VRSRVAQAAASPQSVDLGSVATLPPVPADPSPRLNA
jgi:hypothetical protein